MMIRSLIIGFSISTVLSAGAMAADPIGVPACDDFLTKYEACITNNVPAAQKSMVQGQVDQMRKSWTDMAKNPQAKPALEGACKSSAEQMKAVVAAYKCTF
jgi:hypothetical protein